MANDLILFSCKACKKWIRIAKYYPSTGIFPFTNMTVSEFIEAHADCHWDDILDDGLVDLAGNPRFELHTESAFELGPLTGRQELRHEDQHKKEEVKDD